MAHSAILFLSLLLLLLPIMAMGNKTLGSSLSAGGSTSWSSPSGEFAFGFQKLNSNLFLLSIWFDKIPDKTIVWHANETGPVHGGSKVELTANGLSLTNHKGSTIWSQGSNAAVAYAAMLDTGNFVLAGTDSVVVWESFKNPTDTLLPTQSLDSGGMLFSRLSETNYSKGRFELRFSDGNFQLNPIAWPSEFQYDLYYNFTPLNRNSSEFDKQLIFDESMNLSVVKENGETVKVEWDNTVSSPNQYYRATLDFNGVFTQYSHPRSSNGVESWSTLRYVPDNICTAMDDNQLGSGVCGYNSYCNMSIDGRPRCECPRGYSLIDIINEFGGCKPNFPQGCGVNDGSRDPEELFDFDEIPGLNWPAGQYERLGPYNQTECKNSCLHDCACAVAVNSSTGCYKKKLPLTNGRFSKSYSGTALIKVRKGVLPTGSSGDPIPSGKKDKSILILIGSILLGGSVLFNVLLLVVTSIVLFSRHKGKPKNAIRDSYVSETNFHLFTYKDLEEATNGFKEELGRGSCGIVYKGILKSGSRNLVAVKKLNKLAQEGEKEFRTEVSAIGKTHQKNLVRLLGFCDEGPHQVLVYEFMSNGTLANFLFRQPKPYWNQRVPIALGIAGGLVYLHEECDAPIIHCDIKPQNILLDDYFKARISDFGLAKLLLSDQTRTQTGIRGTRGYIAPEWFKYGPVTVKVDVYSFGVVLLEIICCRKNVEKEFWEEESAILTDWAYDCFISERLDELVQNDQGAMGDIAKLRRWVMIAIWCIQEDPSKRPTMKIVREMLDGFVEVPVPPSPSSFSSC